MKLITLELPKTCLHSKYFKIFRPLEHILQKSLGIPYPYIHAAPGYDTSKGKVSAMYISESDFFVSSMVSTRPPHTIT